MSATTKILAQFDLPRLIDELDRMNDEYADSIVNRAKLATELADAIEQRNREEAALSIQPFVGGNDLARKGELEKRRQESTSWYNANAEYLRLQELDKQFSAQQSILDKRLSIMDKKCSLLSSFSRIASTASDET